MTRVRVRASPLLRVGNVCFSMLRHPRCCARLRARKRAGLLPPSTMPHSAVRAGPRARALRERAGGSRHDAPQERGQHDQQRQLPRAARAAVAGARGLGHGQVARSTVQRLVRHAIRAALRAEGVCRPDAVGRAPQSQTTLLRPRAQGLRSALQQSMQIIERRALLP